MKEQWDYNGDGFCLIVFDFSQLGTQKNNVIINNNFKELPIVDKLEISEIPESYLRSRFGYYLLQKEKDDLRDFKIFIIDTELKKGILYYQIMLYNVNVSDLISII